MPTVEDLELKVSDLEFQMAQVVEVSSRHGQEHTDEGRDPMLGLNQLRSVATTALLPATSDTPTIYYVTGPPLQLFLIDSTGKRELGYSALAAATAILVLTDANQDVPGATLTLPQAATYVVRAVYDFAFLTVSTSSTDIAAVGVLTNSSGVEFDSPRAAVFIVPSETTHSNFRISANQQWIVTTTTTDEVIKLMARKSGLEPALALTTVITQTLDTTILASSFLGGGTTPSSHQHSHEDLTTSPTAAHHTKYTDVEARDAVPSRIYQAF